MAVYSYANEVNIAVVICLRFEQDTGHLFAVEDNIVWPFDFYFVAADFAQPIGDCYGAGKREQLSV
jgi:hypothetical protein